MTSFHQHFCWRTHKAILQSSDPHRGSCPALSFQSPLVLFWDGSLLWEITKAEPSPSLSFLSVHLDYPFYSTSEADAPLWGGERQKVPLVRWEPSIPNFLCLEGRGENQDFHPISWFRFKLKLKLTSRGLLPTPGGKDGAEKSPTPGVVLEKVISDLLVFSPSGQGSWE